MEPNSAPDISAVTHGESSAANAPIVATPVRSPARLPEFLFLLVALPMGVAMAFLTPPLQVPDEANHLRRAFQVSTGQLASERRGSECGGLMPSGIEGLAATFKPMVGVPAVKALDWSTMWSVSSIPLDAGPRRFVAFNAITAFPPTPYLPGALGIALARLVTDQVNILLVSGRLMNLLAGCLLIALAIRVTPVLKEFFMLAALSPMSLFQLASLSADVMTNATALLFLALVCSAAFNRGRSTPNQIDASSGESRDDRLDTATLVRLIVCGGAMCLMKQGYYPLLLSWWLIPVSRFGSWRRATIGFVVLGLTAAAALGSWGLVMTRIYVPTGDWADPAGQAQYLRDHPWMLLTVLWRSAADRGVAQLREFVGVLGSLDTHLPWVAVWIHLVALALAGCMAPPAGTVRASWWQRVLALSIWFVNWSCLLMTIWITWMVVGSEGSFVQGRYLIPMTPLLGVALLGCTGWAAKPTWAGRLPLLAAIYALAMGLFTLTVLAERYYLRVT